jgi:hypothetical protein
LYFLCAALPSKYKGAVILSEYVNLRWLQLCWKAEGILSLHSKIWFLLKAWNFIYDQWESFWNVDEMCLCLYQCASYPFLHRMLEQCASYPFIHRMLEQCASYPFLHRMLEHVISTRVVIIHVRLSSVIASMHKLFDNLFFIEIKLSFVYRS